MNINNVKTYDVASDAKFGGIKKCEKIIAVKIHLSVMKIKQTISILMKFEINILSTTVSN